MLARMYLRRLNLALGLMSDRRMGTSYGRLVGSSLTIKQSLTDSLTRLLHCKDSHVKTLSLATFRRICGEALEPTEVCLSLVNHSLNE